MPTDPSDTAEPTADEPSADAAPRHVLVVEDDEELAGLLRIWVRNCWGESATVYVEHTVADAQAVLESRSALDVVLLDRRLPDGDAGDLLEEISCRFDAITVMITAVSPGSDLIRLPVTDYLVKPIDDETFVTKLSLLERLDAANALAAYTDARKASLLEYHLDAPEETPLFRRFAARWSYDRLEIARLGSGRAVVYELYSDDAATDRDEGEFHVSITGTLAADLDDLLERGAVEPVGELLPSGEEYAWVRAEGDERLDPDADSIAIYGFGCETPERYVTDDADGQPTERGTADGASGGDRDGDGIDELSHVELASVLESGFN